MTTGSIHSEGNHIQHREIHPEDCVSCISRVLYCWIIPLVKDIKKNRGYTATTLPHCRQADQSKDLHGQFSRIWEQGCSEGKHGHKKPSLLHSMMATRRSLILVTTIVNIVVGMAPIAQTLLVGRIVDYFARSTTVSPKEAYYCGAAVVMLAFIQTIGQNRVINEYYRLGKHCRAVLTCALFKKVLECDYGKLNKIGSGKMLTHFSTDLETITQCFSFLGAVSRPVIGLPLCTYLLYREAGLLGLAGLLVPVLIIAVFFCLQPLISHLRQKEAQCTEQRIQLMNELIKAISLVKMYCWEKPFSQLISERRSFEMKAVMQTLCPQSILSINQYVNESLTHFVAVMVITNAGIYLKQGLIVRVFGYLDMCSVMLVQFSIFLFRWTEAYKSLKRMEEFLCQASYFKKGTAMGEECCVLNNNAITLTNVSAMWSDEFHIQKVSDNQWIKEPHGFILKSITMTLKQGEFLAVAGSVGSGKSSLLMTVLGYLQIQSGCCHVNGSVAFVPQEPWIFSDSVRNNILFGEDLNFGWYTEVTFACGLQKDIDGFQYGDQTIVGERGLKLSGGQKARISLARAVYQNRDIYILDDPLAAVDVHVGNHLLQECLCKLLSTKTRLLVTHNIQCFEVADRIAIMQEGALVVIGNYDEIGQYIPPANKSGIEHTDDVSSVNSQSHVMTNSKNEHRKGGAIEQSERGSISWANLKKYVFAGHGYFTLVPYIVITILFQGSISFADWWAADWANEFDNEANISYAENTTIHLEHRGLVYSVAIVCTFSLAIMACCSLLAFVYLSSKNIHDMMFNIVLRSPTCFFYNTPVGITLNRFSRDLGQVDKFMYTHIMATLPIFAKVLGLLVLSCLAVPWAALGIVFCLAFLLTIRHYGAIGQREFKRLEAVCSSPIFSYVSSTLDGLQTIRVFGKEEQSMTNVYKLQDQHSSAFSIYLSFASWMGLYGGLTIATYLTVLLVAAFILNHFGVVNPGLLGIVIIQNISLTLTVQIGILGSIRLENTLTSVERVLAYTTLPKEEEDNDYSLPPVNWPTQGSIAFKNVSLQYDVEGPYALSNISLVFKPREKIGVVGRTGAGKSSLLTVLMRLAQYEGHIYIDGININTLKLEHSRQIISIIPQDPFLFSGTLRKNLDPFGQFTDDEIWVALTQVQMAEYVVSTKLQLDTQAGEYGSHLSVGQKQLICLARALLKKNGILVMDEATANVDHRTDTLIQDTIRRNFHDCTVVTIAHRIHTVIDADRVLVLSSGAIVEFDSPEILLRDKTSALYNLLYN